MEGEDIVQDDEYQRAENRGAPEPPAQNDCSCQATAAAITDIILDVCAIAWACIYVYLYSLNYKYYTGNDSKFMFLLFPIIGCIVTCIGYLIVIPTVLLALFKILSQDNDLTTLLLIGRWIRIDTFICLIETFELIVQFIFAAMREFKPLSRLYILVLLNPILIRLVIIIVAYSYRKRIRRNVERVAIIYV